MFLPKRRWVAFPMWLKSQICLAAFQRMVSPCFFFSPTPASKLSNDTVGMLGRITPSACLWGKASPARSRLKAPGRMFVCVCFVFGMARWLVRKTYPTLFLGDWFKSSYTKVVPWCCPMPKSSAVPRPFHRNHSVPLLHVCIVTFSPPAGMRGLLSRKGVDSFPFGKFSRWKIFLWNCRIGIVPSEFF